MGGCPAYAAPSTSLKSAFVSPIWVTLWRNNAEPPLSTNCRTALPCSGFIQNCPFPEVGGTAGSDTNCGLPPATHPALLLSSGYPSGQIDPSRRIISSL